MVMIYRNSQNNLQIQWYHPYLHIVIFHCFLSISSLLFLREYVTILSIYKVFTQIIRLFHVITFSYLNI